MKKTITLLVAACIMLSTLGACARYYKVRDPASDKVYYTDDVDHLRGGTVRFKDEVTQQTITLGSSEVIRITKDEFRANIHGR